MKKKLFYILAIFMMLAPCLMLASCGSPKQYKITAQANEDVFIILKDSFVNREDGTTTYSTIGEEYVDSGKSVTFDVLLKNYCDINTLSFAAGDEDPKLTKNPNYNENAEIGEWLFQVAGSITFTPKADTEILVACNQKTLNFNFKVKDDAVISAEKQDILKDFSIENTNLYTALTTNYTYKTYFKDLYAKDLNIPVKCEKHLGYYNLDTTNTADPTLWEVWTRDKNDYNLSIVNTLNSNNTVEINPNMFDYAEFNVNVLTGSSITSGIDSSSSFKSNDTAMFEKINITRHNNAALADGIGHIYINDEWTTLNTIESSCVPLDFVEYNDGDTISDVMKYLYTFNIELRDVYVEDITNAFMVKVDTNIEGVYSTDSADCYYTDLKGMYIYDDSSMYGQVYLGRVGSNIKLAETLVIASRVGKDESTEPTIEVINIASHLNDVREDSNIRFTQNGYEIVIDFFGPDDESTLENVWGVTVKLDKALNTVYTISMQK